MPEFIPYDYNQSAMVVINYLDQLQPGTFEYAIHYLIDHKLDKIRSRIQDLLQAHQQLDQHETRDGARVKRTELYRPDEARGRQSERQADIQSSNVGARAGVR